MRNIIEDIIAWKTRWYVGIWKNEVDKSEFAGGNNMVFELVDNIDRVVTCCL